METGLVLSCRSGSVEIVPAEDGGSCSTCHSRMFCSVKDGKRTIKAICSFPVKPGDAVEFETIPGILIKFAVLAFALPSSVLIGTLILSVYILPDDSVITPLVSGILCFASFLITKFAFRKKALPARIVRIIKQ